MNTVADVFLLRFKDFCDAFYSTAPCQKKTIIRWILPVMPPRTRRYHSLSPLVPPETLTHVQWRHPQQQLHTRHDISFLATAMLSQSVAMLHRNSTHSRHVRLSPQTTTRTCTSTRRWSLVVRPPLLRCVLCVAELRRCGVAELWSCLWVVFSRCRWRWWVVGGRCWPTLRCRWPMLLSWPQTTHTTQRQHEHRRLRRMTPTHRCGCIAASSFPPPASFSSSFASPHRHCNHLQLCLCLRRLRRLYRLRCRAPMRWTVRKVG